MKSKDFNSNSLETIPNHSHSLQHHLFNISSFITPSIKTRFPQLPSYLPKSLVLLQNSKSTKYQNHLHPSIINL